VSNGTAVSDAKRSKSLRIASDSSLAEFTDRFDGFDFSCDESGDNAKGVIRVESINRSSLLTPKQSIGQELSKFVLAPSISAYDSASRDES